MESNEELVQENRALRDRLHHLAEASLRINESLDYDVVLQEVIDNARYLTGSRYGVIASLDEAGGLDTVLSSGTTEAEHQQLMEVPEGLKIFEHFRQLSVPTNEASYHAYATSVGLNTDIPLQVGRFLSAPIKHQRESVGTVYLGRGSDGREFSEEDVETLVTFASQAALVIANARRYRDEQRARNDLEALIDTSPVGVIVFDARTGAPVSFNREAMRIAETLMAPEHPTEQLLEAVLVRRSDGREFPLQDLYRAEVLSAGQTVRAEEILLTGPDGRALNALVNATTSTSEQGKVERVVVTLQDLTALEDMERLRAEFLAMVSHELRTPLSTVRGSVSALLDEVSQMHPTEVRQFHRIILEQTDRMRALIADLLDVARIETGTLPISPEPTDLAALVDDAGNAFRLAGSRHNLRVDIPPDLPWVMADRFRIVQVLSNLLTNASRHSPDSSTITVSAAPGNLHVSVSVADEGQGIPAERLPFLFRKFSRIESEEQGSDTGLGLAVCKGIVEAHGGRIGAISEGPGRGALFTFTLPTIEEAGFVSPALPTQLATGSSRSSVAEQVRILAVDDDPQALRYIRDAVAGSGYVVVATGDPQEALRLMSEEKPELVLLDLMLPGVDGIELMQEIMNQGDVPVIFVSAYGQDNLIARAFEMGADDYVVKPFSPTELVARIRAALRRRAMPEPRTPYVRGDLTINYVERRVTLQGHPVHLTAIEYRLIAELSANAGHVLTYQHLLRRVWGTDGHGDMRPMRTAISAIRHKLGDNAEEPAYILTEFRTGYLMPRPDASAN